MPRLNSKQLIVLIDHHLGSAQEKLDRLAKLEDEKEKSFSQREAIMTLHIAIASQLSNATLRLGQLVGEAEARS